MSAAGKIDANCVAIFDWELLRLYHIKYEIDQFDFDGYGFVLQEPRLEGQGNLNYNLATGQLAFSKLVAQGRSIAANSELLAMPT